jgi:hypothetical protein
MPNGILDPADFTIAPGSMRSLQDRILELRRGLPETLQGPQVGGQPQQTQQEQTSQGLGDQINRAAQALAAQTVQSQTPQGEKPKRKGVQDQLNEYQSLLDQVNPLKPKQSIGGGTLGTLIHGEDKGGIFGTGIQPVDVLAFALGAAITSRMPQDKAIATTMNIAKMPGQFRESQENAAKEFLQQKMSGINAEVSVANAETAQLNSAKARQQFDSRTKLANAFRLAGRESDALALEAGAVDEYEKLTGENAKLPANLQFFMSGVATGAIQQVPESLKTILGAKTDVEARDAATAWLQGHLATQPVIPLPGGGAVGRSVGGPQIIEGAPSLPTSQTIPGIRQQLEQQRRGVAPIPVAPTAPSAPLATLAPTAPRAPIAPTAPQAPAYIGSGQIAEQLAQSKNPQDQWVAKYYNDMPAESQVKIAPLFQRQMDIGDRQKLVAQTSALNFAEKLQQKYEAMVTSHGGDKKFKFTDQMKQYASELGTRVSAEGATASALGIAADFARAAAQRYGKEFTTEDYDFMAHYAQAQSYARGAMNDAANLATRERDMFRHMIGTLLDKPSAFRASVGNFLSNIGDNYNILLKANQLRKSSGFEPYVPPSQMPKWFRPLNQEQAPTQPGGEY